jgi:hypothetical protein
MLADFISNNTIDVSFLTEDRYNELIEILENSSLDNSDAFLTAVKKDLSEYHPKKFWKTPPAFTNENRMSCLSNILYTPSLYNNHEFDLENLPKCINLQDDDTWKKIRRPGRDLQPNDYILYKIPDFEIYYAMEYELYLKLLSFNKFEIHYIAAPIAEKYDTDFLTSLDKNQIPSIYEKMEAIEGYFSDDLFSITNTYANIDSIDNLLQSLIFFATIMSYIKYFGVHCYAGESTIIKIRNFAIFGNSHGCYGDINFDGKILLTDLEMTYDKILETFLKMIMKG